IILGDHGLRDARLEPNQDFRSIFFDQTYGAGPDLIYGDSGDDFILGQQGPDVIFGNDGEDDITGGHNVLFGLDGNDTIDGGNHADVILGDNGLLLRTLLEGYDDQWERYPDPFPDVIRTVQRYDDEDYISGDDSIRGGEGDDIVHGQRGNDEIEGNGGDDELLGELDTDTIRAGAGNDTVLADVGAIIRDYHKNGTPRQNDNGSWHRDVFLEMVGTITDSIPMHTTPLEQLDPSLAKKLLEADYVVAAGVYNGSGAKVTANNGAWETHLLLIDVTPWTHDELDGGDGEDVLFGQRGNDTIHGGEGDDLVVGDQMDNQVPFWTQMPHVSQGIRLIENEDSRLGVQLDQFGSVFTTPMTFMPEEFQMNDPYHLPMLTANIVAAENSVILDHVEAGNLQLSNGTQLKTYARMVPDVVRHTEVLPGNDNLAGDGGDDLILADQASVYSPVIPGMQTIEDARTDALDAFARLMHSFGITTLDFTRQQHELGTADHLVRDVRVASDVIDGGAGNDRIIGDEGLIIGSYELGLPVSETTFALAHQDLQQYLLDLQHLATDAEFVVFEAHYQILSQRIASATGAPSTVSPDLHRLFIGNDQIQGGGGDDLIDADHGTLITPLVTGERFELIASDSHIPLDRWLATEASLVSQRTSANAALANHMAAHHNRSNRNFSEAQLQSIPWDFEYQLSVGNDVVGGGSGDDLIIGDFGAIGIPVLLVTPPNEVEKVLRELEIKELLDNIARHLETRHHDFDYDKLLLDLPHAYFGERGGELQQVIITAGSDAIQGNEGNDYVLGDSVSVAATFLADSANPRFDERDPEFKVNFLDREFFETTNHYHRSFAGSIFGNDTIDGGAGHDFLYGQTQNDIVSGGPDNDSVFGGTGFNTVDGGAGVNDVRSGSDDRPDRANLDVLEELVFDLAARNDETFVRNMIADPEVPIGPYALDPVEDVYYEPLERRSISATTNGVDIFGRTGGDWWVAKSDGSQFTNVKVAQWSPAVAWANVRSVDIDGDGDQDILGRAGNQWWVAKFHDGEYSNQFLGAWSTSVGWIDILVGDFNADGLDDVAGRLNGTWHVSLSDGQQFVTTTWGRWSTAVKWDNVMVADVDGDGRSDIVGRTGGQWWVAKSNGTSFTNQLWGAWSNAVTWKDVMAADIDGDGDADLVGRANGQWWVANSNGSAFVNQYWGRWADAAWTNVTLADIDGDDHLDIVGKIG
ncbi:MAG: VCBS repeat-containing protein, partial [Planctomycetales bacterium]|nr:VCBS repeat-containing protein [Planctomycetales bacterium]